MCRRTIKLSPGIRKIFLPAFLIAIPFSLTAGSADAVIKGTTESGRTELNIRVGDISDIIRSVELTIDGESYTIKESEIDHQTVISDRENGIYVLSLRSKGREFKLWMIPNTEKIVEEGPGVLRTRFAAILEATDPRKSKGTMTPRITIGCHFNWAI